MQIAPVFFPPTEVGPLSRRPAVSPHVVGIQGDAPGGKVAGNVQVEAAMVSQTVEVDQYGSMGAAGGKPGLVVQRHTIGSGKGAVPVPWGGCSGLGHRWYANRGVLLDKALPGTEHIKRAKSARTASVYIETLRDSYPSNCNAARPVVPATVTMSPQGGQPVHLLRSTVMSPRTWIARLAAIAVLASLSTVSLSVTPVEAQFGKRLKERLKRNAEDKAIDKAVDKENEAIDAATSGKANEDTARATAAPTEPGSTATAEADASAGANASTAPTSKKPGPTTILSRGSEPSSSPTSPKTRSATSPSGWSSRPARWK